MFELPPLEDIIGSTILIPFPFLANLPELSIEDLATPEYVGAWWLMGIALISSVFNYFLGEELLFRGILLPKMKGVFGKWDWAANAVLFAIYHLHYPTKMLGFIVGGMAWTLPARYFRSIWFPIILHGIEGIFLLVMVFAVVSGLAF
jgi:membrane protease YdiL (CAAX protease family)